MQDAVASRGFERKECLLQQGAPATDLLFSVIRGTLVGRSGSRGRGAWATVATCLQPSLRRGEIHLPLEVPDLVNGLQ